MIPYRDKEKVKLSQQAAAAVEEFLNSGRSITVVQVGETRPLSTMAEIHDRTFRGKLEKSARNNGLKAMNFKRKKANESE